MIKQQYEDLKWKRDLRNTLIALKQELKEENLARHIIMANYILYGKIKLTAKPGCQLHQRIICLLCKLPGFVLVAALNRQRVCIPVIGSIGDLL